MRRPWLWALSAGLAVLVAAFVPAVWQLMRPGAVPAAPPSGLPAPWEITRPAAGMVQAFGLRLPGSTLADARGRWGDELQLALVESAGQGLALEAYVERWSGGGLLGRLVLAADVPLSDREAWRERSPRREVLEGGSRRWALASADLQAALRAPVTGMSFLPGSRVDGPLLEQRLGAPAERLALPPQEHLLYPDRGLAVALDPSRGRAVLQVVAPADFEARLAAPLHRAIRAAAASAPAAGPTR